MPIDPAVVARRLALRERKLASAAARFQATVDSGEYAAACAAAEANIKPMEAHKEPLKRTLGRLAHGGLA